MSQYYNSQRKSRLYNPNSENPFQISRSKIDLFVECPRCFYYDCRLGVKRPPGYPFTLNRAVDLLLKQEFDVHRANQTKHPLIEEYGIDAQPIPHKDLEKWRNNFTGIRYLHEPSNLLIFGAIDDLWQNTKGEYIVVDYKATSKTEKVTSLNKGWQDSYKRQMEIYQWLLRGKGYRVSSTGYFVYCNGITDKNAFDKKLEFEITLIPYTGNADWIDKTILDIKQCLDSNQIPDADKDCDYCSYVKSINSHVKPK